MNPLLSAITQFFLSGLIVALIVMLWWQRRKNKKDYAVLFKVLNSFNELDEQAKLIVKTDLELNKAQEELDKRLNGLDALQKTSRLISTTLDENEMFQRLNQPLLSELGFEKYLILVHAEDNHLRCRVNFGFSAEEVARLIPLIQDNSELINVLQEKQLVSSLRNSQKGPNDFNKLFHIKHFVIAPILEQKNMFGIVFAGNASDTFPITEGDEELISILADQIGQAVKNARLFEEVYRTSQSLELKVQDRTKELSSALGEVQKISKTKSEFISAVSHELRTPLTSIKGYASLLMTGKLGDIPANVKDRLEKINKHSDNLVKLINDLLDISRIESGRVEMKIAPRALSSLIEAVRDLLAPQMREKNIQFIAELDPAIPEISVDASQIERVFINLISNAVKFTRPNGSITVRVNPDEEKVTIAISDTGIGMREEDMANLFTEFYRIDNEVNQNVKGTGLGLALCKKIVEAHKGRIWVTSKLGLGSTFYFTLPLKDTDATA